MAKYDYLIVGAGLFGAVFAYEANKRGKSCLVIDKRSHIAGNIYTEQIEGINVHKYGAHIFHTSDKKIWEYVNQFAEFNNYINSPVASYKDELYNLPFNMNTFSKMWGIKKPSEAKAIIEKQIADLNIGEPKNLEEQALKLAGTDVYEKLVKGYTEKQWGRPCTELPAFIIKRLPLRFIYDNNYFNDRFQGIPMGGYTQIIEKMLEGADVKTDTDYFDFIKENPDIADKTVYTGMIDEFFGFQYGPLEYRSVRFETEVLDERNWQAYSDGISTDSWAMTCGKEGKFTGIATRGDSVIFFKENYALKIYGTKPSNFTLAEYNVPGVEIGSEKSLVNINSTLFYLGHNGVYAYQSGSLPALISEESLWGHTYKNAVGGRHGNKYYISAERDDGEQELLVYDTDKGLWQKEDNAKMIDCTTYNGVLYWLDETKENIMCPDKADNLLVDNTKYEYQQEDCFEWSAETGDLYDSELNVKNIGKIRIGIKAENGAKVSLFVQYKDNGEWRKVSEMLYSEKKPRVFAVALRRAEYLRLKLVGTGQVEIYGIDIEHSRGSDKRGYI